MADNIEEKKGMDGLEATAHLVGHATSGALVAAAVAFPPLAILYALGFGAILLAGAGSGSEAQK